jgi:hypothetical protein
MEIKNRERWIGLIGVGGALLLIAVLGGRLHRAEHQGYANSVSGKQSAVEFIGWRASRGDRTAEEIVTAKVTQFGQNRRKIATALAARAGVQVPDEVTRFFEAVEAQNWPEIDRLFTELSSLMREEPRPKDLEACWPAVMDTLGVVAEARKWPAEKLLDYADAILGSLKPGTIYVGGTDPGRFIPTLVNETSAGEQHIVITQNALADRLYLDYIGFLYKDRMAIPTEEEQRAAFADYLADASKRLEHDLQFPDEPKQVAPGESVRFKDGESGEVLASGHVPVMAVNERLLRRIMEKNPDAGIALEESFPMKSTYPEAALLGPILELRSSAPESNLTSRNAEKAVDYWRQTAEKLLADQEGTDSFSVMATWSKMAAAQANLMADRKLFKEAEETYRLARRIFPGSPEASYGLAQLLADNGQTDDAQEIASRFRSEHSVHEPPADRFPIIRGTR